MHVIDRLHVEGFDLLQVIGEGNAGTVYLARSTPTSNNVAIKIIPCAKVRGAVRREVATQLQLSHPNIVPLHRVTLARLPHAPPALALVMDHAPAGDMFSEVAATGGLPPRLLRRRLRDIASGLAYLHSKGIAHLDVKLENIVISDRNTAQLIDFGCARRFGGGDCAGVALGGTLQYIPPEVVKNANIPPSPESDAWALGVVAYTSLVGSYPFNGARSGYSNRQNDMATRERISDSRPHRISSSVDLPSDLRNIIFGLLEKDPANRMTINEVIAELEKYEAATGRSRKIRVPYSKYGSKGMGAPRSRSPTGAAEADFTPSEQIRKQTREEALHVVDSIQRSRAKAAEEVRLFMSELTPKNRDRDYAESRGRRSSSAVARPHRESRKH